MRVRAFVVPLELTGRMRKAVLGAVGALSMLLGGCVFAGNDELDAEVDALSDWARTEPALEDLKFYRGISGGFQSSTVNVSGDVAAETVPEFVDALVALHNKEAEVQQGAIRELTSHVSAEIGGTSFWWTGPFPSEQFGGEVAGVLSPFAAPEVEKVEVSAASREGAYRGWVYREASISDGEARDFRDAAYEHLGARGGDFALHGFPPAGRLLLDDAAAALPFIERVAAASRMRLDSVDNRGTNSVWGFYTEDPFDEADVCTVVELLASPVDGKTATLVLYGPDGRLGRAYVGQPRDAQPARNEPWSAQLQAIAAS